MKQSKHRLYSTWNSMKQRCSNPNLRGFQNYGGRGITVDPRWLNFQNFIEDMWPSFQEGLSLDRIDNDRGYSKDNCRWTDRVTQRHNSRPRTNMIRLEAFGTDLTLQEWASALEINIMTLYNRVYRKWAAEKILTTPSKRTHLEFCHCTHSISEWASILEIPKYTIQNRIRSGWETERILTTPFIKLKRSTRKNAAC